MVGLGNKLMVSTHFVTTIDKMITASNIFVTRYMLMILLLLLQLPPYLYYRVLIGISTGAQVGIDIHSTIGLLPSSAAFSIFYFSLLSCSLRPLT